MFETTTIILSRDNVKDLQREIKNIDGDYVTNKDLVSAIDAIYNEPKFKRSERVHFVWSDGLLTGIDMTSKFIFSNCRIDFGNRSFKHSVELLYGEATPGTIILKYSDEVTQRVDPIIDTNKVLAFRVDLEDESKEDQDDNSHYVVYIPDFYMTDYIEKINKKIYKSMPFAITRSKIENLDPHYIIQIMDYIVQSKKTEDMTKVELIKELFTEYLPQDKKYDRIVISSKSADLHMDFLKNNAIIAELDDKGKIIGRALREGEVRNIDYSDIIVYISQSTIPKFTLGEHEFDNKGKDFGKQISINIYVPSNKMAKRIKRIVK